MHKKLAATLTIAIFLISTLAIMAPVQAHFTLGRETGLYRYHAQDFDPHVAGPIGYVWPGGGQNGYSGQLAGASSLLAPGYQSPWPGTNPPGAPSTSWYQLEGSTYAPFGAVLTDSTGDLIFALNATCASPAAWTITGAACGSHPKFLAGTLTATFGWDTWMILIPPEFTVPGAASFDSSRISSTLSNSYERYFVAKLSPSDRYAPNWTLVSLTVDAGRTPGYNHQYINFTAAGEWYYARINGVKAPATAGRYFFKMFLYSSSNTYGVGPTVPGGSGITGENPDVWVPPQNWPVMLVKGEVDPAIITGTLRYGGYNASLYGQPIGEAGKVWAKMTTRIDPYTGQQRPDLPMVDAQAFVNATAYGHYELEGLAPGIYDLYASAAGFPQTLIASGVTVLKGQSLHFDGYLQPGPVIHGNVFTKHQFGDQPWPGNSTTGQYMKIELYDGPTLSHLPDASANLVSWSPLPCVAGGQETYYGRRDAQFCGNPRNGGAVAFPWHEYSTVNPAVYNDPANLFTGAVNGYTRDVSITATFGNAILASDPQGVGPPQRWFVRGATTTPFHFEFGLKGEYGAPRDLSGMVPQVYATWINGLTPGRYYARAWTFRYVQSALDGSTFQEYYFDVTPNEWAGDVTLPIDLRLSSWVNKTVYFHNSIQGITTDPITTGAGYIQGDLKGADGHIYAYNTTNLGYNDFYYGCNYNQQMFGQTGGNANNFGTYTSSATGTQYIGTGETGAPSRVCSGESNFLNKAHYNRDSLASGRAVFQLWGINDTWGGENYGIPSGTYTVDLSVLGYRESDPGQQVSVTLSGNPTAISDHMIRGPGFNVSVYSIDWERPRVSRPWVWGDDVTTNQGLGSEIDIGWYAADGSMADYIGDEPAFLPASIGTTQLYQGLGGQACPGEIGFPANSRTCVEMDGGGRNVLYQLITLGGITTTVRPNAHEAYFGQNGRYGLVGGYTSGSFGWLRAKKLRTDGMFTAGITVRPLHFEDGPYNLRAYTYGYVQDKDFTAYAQTGQVADMKINLIIGVNVTLDILFKKESIITGTPFNMSARVRLFNDRGEMVATWMSSEGTFVDRAGHAVAADGAARNGLVQYPFMDQGSGIQTPAPLPLNGYNYLPGGVNLLHVLMAGLPQQPPFGTFITGVYFGDPLQGGSCDFELDCYPATYGQYPFPDSGILGAPDYTGGWTAEVDFVNWYLNNTGYGVPATVSHYFPPVPGLLMGESYHIIPGTTATLGISLTEDMAVDSNSLGFVGHTMAWNHLGPYSQQGVWQIAGTHNSGEASAIFEVDLNGFVTGNALAFTWSNEFRPLSWGLVSVTGASGATWNFYTFDAIYEAYLTPGTYQFTISSPGYAEQAWSVSVSSGQSGTGQNVYLEQNNIPVPEFSGIAVVAFSALAASLYLLRRRRR